MSLIVFQHHPNETAARLGEILRDLGHRLRVIRLDAGQALPADLDDVDGVLSLGGPMNVGETDRHPWMPAEIAYLKAAHQRSVPVVGLCLGAQLIAAALDGKVAAMPQPEVGFQITKLSFPGTTEPVFQGIPWETMQYHLHGQEVTQLPPDATLLASSKACKHQAFKVGLTTYAFQYHFEWTERDLKDTAGNALVRAAGLTAPELGAQLERHYESYRRLGDRLCENLGLLLFVR